MASTRNERATTRAGKWLLVAVVPGSALALGSLTTPMLVVMTIAAAVACALLWLERPSRTARAARWVLVALGLLIGMTLLQAIPLPARLVSVIAPANADVWARALTPFREAGPGWHSLSVAPSATHVELLRGTLYACVFLGALRIVLSEGGTAFLERVVVGSTSVIALVTLAHAAVHASRVFGVYSPHAAYAFPTGRLGPLLNSNHVAAYLNIGAFAAAGIAVSDRHSTPRLVSLAAGVLLAGTSVWAGSRGGMGSLVLGVMLFGVLSFYRRRERKRGELVVAAMMLVAAGVLLGVGGSDVAREEMAVHDLSKLQLGKRAAQLIPMTPVFGIGRGAFETMYPLVHEGRQYVTSIRVENVAVQWLVEWGVPVALAAALALALALRPRSVLSANRPPIGAWTAIVVAVVHDLVDFHLEVPAVVVLLSVCAALVVGARPASSPESRTKREGAARLQMIAWGASVGAIVATLVVLPGVNHSLLEDRDSVSKIAVDRTVTREAFRSDIRAMMLRHPAEPFFPLAGAIRAQASAEDSVIPWIARALERYPNFGRAHLVLARSLVPEHLAQARLEYRLAYENDVSLRAAVVKEGARLAFDVPSALELVPDGADGLEMLESLVTNLGNHLPSTSFALDRELERRAVDAKGPMRRAAAAAASDALDDAPWCGPSESCVSAAIAIAEELARREPEKCESHVLVARLRIKQKNVTRALDDFNKALAHVAERPTCHRQFISLALEAGAPRRADEALEQLVRGGCGAAQECIDLYTWAAGFQEGRGHYVGAVRFYRRVIDLMPEREDLLERIGELGDKDGVTSEALDAYATLATRHPGDPRYPARIAELRARARAPKPL